MAENWV